MFYLHPFRPLDQPSPSPRSNVPAKVYQRLGPKLNLKNSVRYFAYLVYVSSQNVV